MTGELNRKYLDYLPGYFSGNGMLPSFLDFTCAEVNLLRVNQLYIPLKQLRIFPQCSFKSIVPSLMFHSPLKKCLFVREYTEDKLRITDLTLNVFFHRT